MGRDNLSTPPMNIERGILTDMADPKKEERPEVDLDALNAQLAESGVGEIKDLDKTPERTAYWNHINNESPSDKDYFKILKALKAAYRTEFHTYVSEVYPHLRYENGEDKTYWNYDKEAGIYIEINFVQVRGMIIALMLEEGLNAEATEASAKMILSKYRAVYTERGSEYDAFDNYPEWFHANNGWVKVVSDKKGQHEFEPHTPERLSRRVSAVAYDPNATCRTYDHFLDSQMGLQKDQVQAIDQFSGLLLTPEITQQKMLVLIGKPGSGKSTLLDCWSDVLGECATQAGLTEIASESFRFGGSKLVGKHLCWFDEVEVTRSNMGNHLINLITGQTIRVERKGINGIVEAENRLKCVLTANTLPRSAEMGIYRRMILIYLEYSFYDSMTANKNIRSILQAEASGILNRMLKGLASMQKVGGFVTIDGHEDMIEEYKTSSNTMAEFLDEHFEFDYDAAPLKSKVLLEAYKNFANDRYSESLTPQRFGVALKQHGLFKFDKIYSKKDPTGNKVWCGLKLKEYYELNPSGFIRENENF